MSLIGSLEDLSLGDILQIISLSQKSGVLVIRTDDGAGRIVFRGGLVRGASTKDDPGGLRGSALFEALSSAIFARFDVDWYAWKSVLVPLCYVAFLLEPVAAFALWVPRLRTACALALLAMHLTLELLTNVGWWNFVMAGGVACFLPTSWLARLLPGPPR